MSLTGSVLLCPTHHRLVDGQHESYPAEVLKDWKQNHECKIEEVLSSDLGNIQTDVFSHPYFPTALVDHKIENEIDVLRKSRFYVEFDTVRFSLMLAKRVAESDLSGGTDAVRCRALAWCARLLSVNDRLTLAEEYLRLAKTLSTSLEIDITDAFLTSRKGNMSEALEALARIPSPVARSSALMIVVYHDAAQQALEWLETAGIGVDDLDPVGKYVLLNTHLELERWDTAKQILSAVAEQDTTNVPPLHHLLAITHLLATVPVELRATVLSAPPLATAAFPLASDEAAMDSRRAAQQHFLHAARAARDANCLDAAIVSDEYALWLELKDPDTYDNGRRRLENILRDPTSALRFISFGLEFGIKLDLTVINEEIDRAIALNGGATHDTAIARLALAFHQESPAAVADYIDQHYGELAEYIDETAIRNLQFEMLGTAGLAERAHRLLDDLIQNGLSESETAHFQTIISQAEGADPIEIRRTQFHHSNALGDLASLVGELETHQRWDDLCRYGSILFDLTQDLKDAERLVVALNNTTRTRQAIEFIEAHPHFVAQSTHLRLRYAWTLYLDGQLLKSRDELQQLTTDTSDRDYRSLQVNLAIILGDWKSLLSYVDKEYHERCNRSAHDLMDAAKLALHLGSPHAKDLIRLAAEAGHEDATILMTAYGLAVRGGWQGETGVVDLK